MSEIPMHLPASFSEERGKIETKILDFSSRIFINLKAGICFSILLNSIYLYYWYYKTPISAIIIFYILLILVFHIIIFQFQGNK